MNINATLLVQIVNFYLFYHLVRFFLFKPAVAVIDSENNEMALLTGLVDQQKKSIEIKEKEHQHFWVTVQGYFKKHQPVLTHQLASSRSGFFADEAVVVGPSDEDVASLIIHVS